MSVFSKYIGYSNEEVYQTNTNDYIVKWIYIEYLDDKSTKCSNIHKTKNNTYVQFEWFSKEVNDCYYCIGKFISESGNKKSGESGESDENKNVKKLKFLKLNNDMTKVLNTYNNKKKLCSLLQITIYRLNKIIDNKELYNGFYYIKYEDCSIELKNK